MLGPVMRAKGCSTGTTLISTRLVKGSSKPTIAEFMIRWRLSHLLGVRRKRLVRFSFIKFLSIHVTMRSHCTSFHRTVHSKREMPGIQIFLGVHDC
jgi:hypothetical protein